MLCCESHSCCCWLQAGFCHKVVAVAELTRAPRLRYCSSPAAFTVVWWTAPCASWCCSTPATQAATEDEVYSLPRKVQRLGCQLAASQHVVSCHTRVPAARQCHCCCHRGSELCVVAKHCAPRYRWFLLLAVGPGWDGKMEAVSADNTLLQSWQYLIPSCW